MATGDANRPHRVYEAKVRLRQKRGSGNNGQRDVMKSRSWKITASRLHIHRSARLCAPVSVSATVGLQKNMHKTMFMQWYFSKIVGQCTRTNHCVRFSTEFGFALQYRLGPKFRGLDGGTQSKSD